MVATLVPLTAGSSLSHQLRIELAETNRPALKHLNVDLSHGLITVRGVVDSFYEKQLAIHACQAVMGAEHWVDAVEVR